MSTTPIALFPRDRLDALYEPHRGSTPMLSLAARKVEAQLRGRGASFVTDLTRATALPRDAVEDALGELVAQGLVTSDGFVGLRALLRTSRARAKSGTPEPGRYALLPTPDAETRDPADGSSSLDVEELARTLLRRWGVVFRKLLERECLSIGWSKLARALRTLEARGEVRGGRFVTGFGGEQFALPDALSALRRLRREPLRGELVAICASDPLNLVGIVSPGARVPQVPGHRIVLRDGVPVAALLAGTIRWLHDVAESDQPLIEGALRGFAPPELHATAASQVALV